MTCPICHNSLAPSDKLIATFIPTHNCWVIRHLKEGTIEENPYLFNYQGSSIQSETHRESCAEAGFQFTK